jgi:hypothetical protein
MKTLITKLFSAPITYFWVEPIKNYRKLKNQIFKDLDLYANAYDNSENKQMQERSAKRKEVLRTHAAELGVHTKELPKWYLKNEIKNGVNITRAIELLLIMSNSNIDINYAKHEDELRRRLGLKNN